MDLRHKSDGQATALRSVLRASRNALGGIAAVFWKELFELFHKPSLPLGLLAASMLVVWTAGKLNVEQARFGVHLYKGDADKAEVKRVREILGEITYVRLHEPRDGVRVDIDAMQRDAASLAVVYRDERWQVLHGFAPARQNEAIEQLASAIGNLLRPGQAPSALVLFDAGNHSRMSALPAEPQVRLIPRTIALIVVFLPFVLATRSYSREVASGTLPLLLGLPNCGWGTLAAGKVAACLWIVLLVLLVMLVAVSFLFDISVKPGLMLQLGVQALAMLVSACLGLLLAVLARSQSQIHLAIALYFLALVLVSGFLYPLDTASPMIRWVSYISPLTFSGQVLETWLLFGSSALIFPGEIACLAAQALTAAFLLAATIALARHRL